MAKPQVKDNETEADKEGFVDELKPGTKLMHGQYTIESFLNAGGFGITYLAKDSLDRKVVIKECFPGAFCRRSRYIVQARSRAHQNELKSIVRLFVQEARSLSKLDHPNIVGVHQVFEDNETAYMALDFVTGRDLLDTIDDPNHGLNPQQVKSILKEILGAVGFIHDQGILHRDISPDNILIDEDYHPVLIDFGAAREEATKQSRVLSALRVVKDGYSPQEFYIAGSEQSPSSDLYALGASFYHLINGEVPPNSQARLAAIAAGESDPYEPLEGRFDDYDEDFLKALDKSLAVLPKNRVQSAGEWLEIMEGRQGNVTPLNVTATTEAVTPAAAADNGDTKKSKLPLLLGSAAAVALLVGVGVMTTSGGDDAPVVEAPASAPVVSEAPAEPMFTTPTAPEAPAEEPVVAEAPAETESAEATIAAALAEAMAAAEEAPAAEEDTAVEDTPVIAQEPAVEETAVEAPEVVDTPVVVDAATPSVRPEPRPESVEIAALPEPEPLPEPVATPQPAVDEPVAEDALPTESTSRSVEASEVAPVALPDTPDNIAEVGAGPDVEISAVTPGNELPSPASVAPAVTGSWTVQMPFSAAADGENTIANAGPIAPVWVEPGLIIAAVNGINIESINEIPAALREQIGDADVGPSIPVAFNTIKPSTGEFVQYNWDLPVVQNTTLAGGTEFTTVFSGTGWTTRVAELPETSAGGLEVGDVLTSFISTGETIDQRESIMTLFERELAAGTEQFSFAVLRDGGLWVASFDATN